MIRKISSTMALMALLVSILTLAVFANDSPSGSVKSDLAQPKVPNTLDSARSLGEILTPDGRFDLEAARQSGYQGSLDLKGFQSAINPATGQPVFRPASPASPADSPDDIYWSPLGSGMNSGVFALTAYDGKLIAGGEFTTAGGVAANFVASWDGNAWSPLGLGTDSAVKALTVYDGKLIAGGIFTTAGGVAANRVASWNGSTWSPLGLGMSSSVSALTVYDGKLVAGGDFTTAGGVSVAGIAAWNSSVWSGLSSGFGGTVRSLTVFDGKLVAGVSSGSARDTVAAWDGSNWSTLWRSDDFYLNSSALSVYNGNLITAIHSIFGFEGTPSLVISWDGSAWSTIGTLAGWFGSVVISLNSYDNMLIAGGGFGGNIQAWNGSTWSILGSGTNGAVRALAVNSNRLVVGGNFSAAGGKVASYIAEWNKVSPRAVSRTPAANALGVPCISQITATFDMDMNSTTINANTFVVTGNTAGRIQGTINYNGATRTATFTPSNPYPAGELVSVALTTGIESASGVPLAQGYTWSFTTAVSRSTGYFAFEATIPSGNADGGVAIAEFNGDGFGDLIQVIGNIVSVMLSNATGGFAPYVLYQVTAGSQLVGFTVADYDGDGDVDIAVLRTNNSYDNYISILLNNGNGVFTVQPSFSCGAGNGRALCTADFDADGHPDLVVGLNVLHVDPPPSHHHGEFAILINNGNGTFQTQSCDSIDFWTDITALWVADLDGDGYSDIVASNGGAYLALLFNYRPYWSFLNLFDLASPSVSDVEIADFDGDGSVDIATYKLGNHSMWNPYDAWLSFYEGLGNRQFALIKSIPVNPWSNNMAVGDIDGDGDVDLLFTYGSPLYYDGDFGSFRNFGDFDFREFGRVGTGVNPTSMAISDLDNDGDLDLAVVCSQQYVDRSVNIIKNLVCVDTDGDGYGDPGHPENACPEDNCPWVYGNTCIFAGATPAGENTTTEAGPVFVTYQNVTQEGTTELSISATGPGVNPAGFGIVPSSLPAFYNVSTTASYNGTIEVCLSYDGIPFTLSEESALSLLHFDGVAWHNITTSVNVDSNTVCGQASSLSPFALALPLAYFCGDANGDDFADISDVVYLIAYIFSGGAAPDPLDAGDANCDGFADISDVVYLIAYIFSGGAAPCAVCK